MTDTPKNTTDSPAEPADLPERRGRPGRLPVDRSAKITRRITALAVFVGIIMAAGKFFV